VVKRRCRYKLAVGSQRDGTHDVSQVMSILAEVGALSADPNRKSPRRTQSYGRRGGTYTWRYGGFVKPQSEVAALSVCPLSSPAFNISASFV
jgi:hypothetical protein